VKILIKHLRGIFLKAEKKENMVKMRAQKKFMGKSNRVNKITFVVLFAGLLLTFFGMTEIGNYIIWACMFVFFVTTLSGILASGSIRRQR
jgi:Zn-dependent membrane protease YugP